MRLKSFYGPTMTDAMRLAREALGENAIIVTTRDDEEGGVRVTAAIDDFAPPQHERHVLPPNADEEGSAVIETIADALVKHQVSSQLAERLLASATQFANEDPVLALGYAFDIHFKFAPLSNDETGGPILFVGPPGAGKTLCTAKFATQATLAQKPVAVISTDTERAGGVEQLAAFTRLLKTDLMEIEDAGALRDAISMQTESGTILIDTAGRNPFHEEERQRLRALIEACGEAVLVLSADMDSSDAIDMAHEFRLLGAKRLLMTRLDMTRRLGGLLRVAFESRLPLANYSVTNNVTEAPQPLNPIALARLVLPKEASCDTEAMA